MDFFLSSFSFIVILGLDSFNDTDDAGFFICLVQVRMKTNTEIRRNFIKKADETLVGAWEDLDEQFFSEEGEDIVSLIVDYIRNNSEEFGN